MSLLAAQLVSTSRQFDWSESVSQYSLYKTLVRERPNASDQFQGLPEASLCCLPSCRMEGRNWYTTPSSMIINQLKASGELDHVSSCCLLFPLKYLWELSGVAVFPFLLLLKSCIARLGFFSS